MYIVRMYTLNTIIPFPTSVPVTLCMVLIYSGVTRLLLMPKQLTCSRCWKIYTHRLCDVYKACPY